MTRGPIDIARLIWAARAEHSRLHRLAIDAARAERHRHRLLIQADARIFRCAGCGEWRYRGDNHRTGYYGARITCQVCGEHRDAIRRAA